MNKIDLPQYKSHRYVGALKLKEVLRPSTEGAILVPEDENYLPFEVDELLAEMIDPEDPGYYVMFADSRQGWLSTEEFESTYEPTSLDG